MHIVCDFDGTISTVDTTDLVLSRLADPAWETLERRWLARQITGAECMSGQIALIRASQPALDAVLDAVEIDPGFAAFAAWCAAEELTLSIVSDGVDYFIQRILARHALTGLSAVANRLAGSPARRRLEQPWARQGCAAGSGVCKCNAAAQAGRAGERLVFIGDGRSDFCVSGHADILFAKGELADYAAARGRAFYPFSTFDDVAAVLARLLREAGPRRVLSLV